IRARTKPPARNSSMSSACSPLRSAMAGASSINAVPSGCESTASTIWLRSDPRAHETAGPQLFDEFGVLALALRDGGREQHQRGALRMRKYRVDHLAQI